MLRSQTTSKRLTKNVSLGCTTNLASVGETCASLEQLAENSDGSTGCSPSVERSGHKNDEVIVFEAPKNQTRIRPQYQSQLYLKDEPSSQIQVSEQSLSNHRTIDLLNLKRGLKRGNKCVRDTSQRVENNSDLFPKQHNMQSKVLARMSMRKVASNLTCPDEQTRVQPQADLHQQKSFSITKSNKDQIDPARARGMHVSKTPARGSSFYLKKEKPVTAETELTLSQTPKSSVREPDLRLSTCEQTET